MQITLSELLDIIDGGSHEERVRLAQMLAPNFFPEAHRSGAMEDTRQNFWPRVTVDDADVTTFDGGTEIWGGPSRFAVLDFIGAAAHIDANDGNTVHIRAAGGGASCMFDFLVSSCWATEVASGRGIEGQTITSLSGCTFKVYSTIQGAVTQAATDFPVSAGGTTNIRVAAIYVCHGSYTETVTAAVALNIFGSSADSVTWIPAAGAGNSCIKWTAATGQGRSRITGFTFHPAASQYGVLIDAPVDGFFFDIYANRFIDTSTATAGISVQTPVGIVTGAYAAIHDNVFAGNGQHVLADWQTHIINNRFTDGYVTISRKCRVVGNRWDDGPSANGCIVIDADPQAMLIASNHFFTGNSGSMAAGIVQTTFTTIGADSDISLSIIDNVVHPNTAGANCEFFNASSITSNSGRSMYVIRGNNVDFVGADISATLIRVPSTADGRDRMFWVVENNVMMTNPVYAFPTLFDTYPDEMHLAQSGNVVYGGSTGDALETGKLALVHKGTTGGGGSIVDGGSIWWPAFHIYFGSTLVTVAAGTYEYPGATASGTYYVSVNSSGTVTANTSGAFPAGEFPLATVVFDTIGDDVTSVVNVVHLLQTTATAYAPAPSNEPFVTIGNTSGLSDERALTPRYNVFGTDGGANGAYTLDSWLEGAPLTPSATVLTLGTDGDVFHVGAGNFATIATPTRQTLVLLIFEGASVLTHSADLILQGAVDFTSANGDVLLFMWEGSTIWREVNRHTTVAHDPLTLHSSADPILQLTSQLLSFDKQVGNVVLAGPTTFPPTAYPTFRALVDADIPSSIARDTEVTTAVSDHAAAADPHTGYALESALVNGKIRAIVFNFHGGGSALATQLHPAFMVPFACTINRWSIQGDQAGTCTIDVQTATDSAAPSYASIVGAGTKPNVAGPAVGTVSTAPSSWTSTAIAVRTLIQANLSAVGTFTWLTLTLEVTET